MTVVENRLRELKPQYKSAKTSGDKEALRELVPELEALMAERRSLMAQPDPVAAAVAPEETPDETDEETSMDEADTLFSQFFTIVNDLLGDELPEEAMKHFSHPMDLNCSRKLAPIQPQSMTNAVENSSR